MSIRINAALVWIFMLLSVEFAQAQPSRILDRFPDTTLAFVRIRDVQETVLAFQETGMGRAIASPGLKPLIDDLYRGYSSQTDFLRERFGLSLDELLAIPKGELFLAVVPTAQEPSVCAVVEAGEDFPAVEILLTRMEAMWKSEGFSKSVSKVGELEIVRHTRDDTGSEFGYFIENTSLVFSTDPTIAQELARIWRRPPNDFPSLSKSDLVRKTLVRCRSRAKEQPHVAVFLNPVGLAFHGFKSSHDVESIFRLLSQLGIDGIQSAAGYFTFATEEYDSIFHGAAMMAKPRRGVLKVARTKGGNTEPEFWVDETATGYIAINLDFVELLDSVREIVDLFQRPNAFEEEYLALLQEAVGINLRKDLFEHFAGRLSVASIDEGSPSADGTQNIYAFTLKNPSEFKDNTCPTLFRSLQRKDKRWLAETYGDVSIYSNKIGIPFREIAFAVYEKQLLVSDSAQVLKWIIDQSASETPLAECLEYKLAMSRIVTELGGRRHSMVYFQQPREQMKIAYNLVKSPVNLLALQALGASRPLVEPFGAALSKNKLPPFQDVGKFFPPSTAVLLEDEDCVELISVSLKVPD